MKNPILPLMLLSTMLSFPLAHAQEANLNPTPNTTPTVDQPVLSDQINYYITNNGVRVRSTPDTAGKVLGMLSLNDKVKIINPTVISSTNMIEIRIVKTYDTITPAEKYYVRLDFLSPKIVNYKEFVGKYFVVVNVATETLRLYERDCVDTTCTNKMIMETEVVVGEDVDHPKAEKGKGRSILGSYRVTGWTKFYEDAEKHYPAWYKEGYPDAPEADAGWHDWFSNRFMPKDETGHKHGSMRGAFGWYTAFAGPEPFGQWTHGTLGWGSDKDKYIKRVKKGFINLVSNPRSSGCTRNNNEAIAFLRSMIDVGAPIIKIYAKEDILDRSLRNYTADTKEWNYVLTKNNNHAIESEEVLKSLGITAQDLNSYLQAKEAGGEIILDPKSPYAQVIEAGTYVVDTHPDVIAYTPGEKLGRLERTVGRKGNVYGIKNAEMHGVFYVDAGLMEGYAHPDTVLEVSGFSDEMTPPWMKR